MGIVDIFFPVSCLECGKKGEYICLSCLEKVGKPVLTCIYCDKKAIDGMTHVKCRRKLGLDSLLAIWRYKGVVRKSILDLKYKFASDICSELTKRMSWEIKRKEYAFPKKTVLVPIPLHKRRKNWRGFNQVEEMGKLLVKRMGWNYSDTLIIRTISRSPQTRLQRKERKTNIRGVFSLNPNFHLLPTNYSVLLFDDVFTTGSTMKEAAKVLKRNGFEKVSGLTVAR